VTLESRRDCQEALAQVRRSSGFVLTHVCRLERIDTARFSVGEADDVLRALNFFLSFSRSLWTPPLLLVGVSGDQVTWREWCRTSGPWRGHTTWLSAHHPESLGAAFPTFMQRWRDPRWKEELQLAVSWLMEAIRQTGTDISVTLAQIALELLGWVILVDERGYVPRRLQGRKAQENLRSLLDWAEIPTAIPGELHDLTSLASTSGWKTGPEALAGFRNMLVHPRDRTRTIFQTPIDAKIDLQQLAFWYVELVLLRLIGYRGEYVNRHRAKWVGEVEPVPWA